MIENIFISNLIKHSKLIFICHLCLNLLVRNNPFDKSNVHVHVGVKIDFRRFFKNSLKYL